MKKLLAIVIVLVLFVAGLGFYRGWFTLSSPDADTGSHKVNINLSMDPDKVKADAEKVKEKTQEYTGQDKDEAKKLDPATDSK